MPCKLFSCFDFLKRGKSDPVRKEKSPSELFSCFGFLKRRKPGRTWKDVPKCELFSCFGFLKKGKVCQGGGDIEPAESSSKLSPSPKSSPKDSVSIESRVSRMSSVEVPISACTSQSSQDMEPRFGSQRSIGEYPVEGRPLPPPGRNTATLPEVLTFNDDLNLPGAVNLDPVVAVASPVPTENAPRTQRPRPKAAKRPRIPHRQFGLDSQGSDLAVASTSGFDHAVASTSNSSRVEASTSQGASGSQASCRPRPKAARGERTVTDNVHEFFLPGYVPETNGNEVRRQRSDEDRCLQDWMDRFQRREGRERDGDGKKEKE